MDQTFTVRSCLRLKAAHTLDTGLLEVLEYFIHIERR
jgi:hypothetical protein